MNGADAPSTYLRQEPMSDIGINWPQVSGEVFLRF